VLALASLVAWLSLLLGSTVTAAPGHLTFDPGSPLDSSEIVDTRGTYGELVCPTEVNDSTCWIERHSCDGNC
jgi:hypothetical protein